MTIKNLSGVPPAHIAECLLVAFENYFVKMPSDYNYWLKRWVGARVDYNLSAGMFDNEKLVGFILHGIDEDDKGEKTAFNCATGVLPSHRRRGIVGDLYNYILPQLKDSGVKKCSLEVITKNDVAIYSYEKVGFEIVKCYKSFFGAIKLPSAAATEPYEWVKAASPQLDAYHAMRACDFSWENNYKALKAMGEDVYDAWELKLNGSLAGYAILKPNGHIVQFGTADRAVLPHLFNKLAGMLGDVRIINIEEKEEDIIAFLQSCGLSNTIDQYYMEYHVN